MAAMVGAERPPTTSETRTCASSASFLHAGSSPVLHARAPGCCPRGAPAKPRATSWVDIACPIMLDSEWQAPRPGKVGVLLMKKREFHNGPGRCRAPDVDWLRRRRCGKRPGSTGQRERRLPDGPGLHGQHDPGDDDGHPLRFREPLRDRRSRLGHDRDHRLDHRHHGQRLDLDAQPEQRTAATRSIAIRLPERA